MLDFSDYKNAERVFYYFEEISKIPHGSGNTKKIADFIERFAISHALEYTRDQTDSIIIRKAATEELSNRPTLILQGHTDMVLAKDGGIEKDLQSEGLDIYIDGDFIRARGTTLGGDDGIAVAYMLAILESKDIPHPPLEAVFTSDEETGLCGAKALKRDMLSGKTMINLDMDVEGIFTAGCAGGVCVKLSLPIKREIVFSDAVQISVSGLRGGHSGSEIGDGRENAIKILVETLKMLQMSLPVRIYSISGGNAENAIPKDAEATILASKAEKSAIIECTKRIETEYRKSESEIKISVSECGAVDSALTEHDSKKLISLLEEEPSGVITMSEDIEGLVQTSLNLGTLTCENGKVAADILIRSSKENEKNELAARVEAIAAAHGAETEREGDYPGWEYKKVSPLREKITEVYRELYNKDADI